MSNVLDLTDSEVRKQVGVSLNDITQTDSSAMYELTQKIGEGAKELGCDGILAPSARFKGGKNVIIFTDE